MEMIVERLWRKPLYTIGRLYLDGSLLCNTLEDTDRGLDWTMTPSDIAAIKQPGKTAIPTGRYRVVFDWSSRFGKTEYAIENKIPLVQGVKGFTYIRIHAGNDEGDTEGCILLGENKAVGKVLNSRYWCKRLNERLWLPWTAGSPIWLTVR